MSLKYKELLITLFGVACIISGSAIIGSYLYLDYQMNEQIEQSVEASKIVIENTNFTSQDDTITSDSDSDSLATFDETIDTLTEDQSVDEVVTYTNVLEIPQLDIKAYIRDGLTKEALRGGVGRHTNTAELCASGNCVIAGHASTTYRCILNRLNEIELYDTFFVYDSEGIKHKYYVVREFVVEPDDTSILSNTGSGVSTITIYTCTNKGKQRFVVIGKEFTEEELEDYKRELKESMLNEMLTLNNDYEIEGVSYALSKRSESQIRLYDVKFFNHEVEKIKQNLYGVVLGDDAFTHEHIYPDDFSINFGITLSEYGGVQNDISEN
jgi:LPXTG-site transpeptidase (sortase) family protein